ncbi:MAG: tetratricopeptide repeat protein [Planctomycetes bacterium]|nr:tetratricopeptide repeat protein [Planctomycetota bacterium]
MTIDSATNEGAQRAGDAGSVGGADAARGRTFTASQLAVLCGLPPAVVKRWIDRELLVPQRGAVGQFAFTAVGRVRTLAKLWRAGWNAPRIAHAWRLARTVIDDPEEALTGLLASIGRRRVTVRTSDGRLVEPGGQLVFDFESAAANVEGAQLPTLRTPKGWFLIAVEAEAAGRIEDAVRAYEHALEDDNPEAHFNLGNCYYSLRRRREAAARFDAAVKLSPDYAEAWNNLGVVRGELQDRDGAILALERALAIVPHYADAHYNLAEALAVAGDLDGARRHWRAYLSFDPNSRWADQVRRYLQINGER